ncbi:hypothetical protein SAMN04489712_103447 [Thermomonospora echinospora]|uniref:Uncharacterized protein n=1 Tax=Thermomonospora echinospora TaxID=1992 RepID=A0A1H5XX29_9ACTN|nr:hypothetical protein [Thermomonospora echinospora]SEG16202.1 hypothetical protein SAMN04489712_103447 [Thermomonospora echinospora]
MQHPATGSAEALVDVSKLTLAEIDGLPELHPLGETLREAIDTSPVIAAAGFDSGLTPF